jgi:hypothetical protein
MIDSLKVLAWFVVSLFRSKGRLEAEIVIRRHQLNVLRRAMPSRARLTLPFSSRSSRYLCRS